MFDRLEQTESRYEELTQALASPDITNDSAKYQKIAKAHSDLVPIVEKFREKYGAKDVKKYYSKLDVAVLAPMQKAS